MEAFSYYLLGFSGLVGLPGFNYSKGYVLYSMQKRCETRKQDKTTRLINAPDPVTGLHIAAGQVKVSVKEAGRQLGGSEHFGIVYFAVRVIFSAEGMKETVNKAVYCNSRCTHGSYDLIGLQTITRMPGAGRIFFITREVSRNLRYLYYTLKYK
uniref:hypothetical protein n=1 Tax=Pontibacter pudoricolor TaxID=2694930 RepID=UPI001391EEF7|nr:hypothetical protein [Pontibacter pudoricolor]